VSSNRPANIGDASVGLPKAGMGCMIRCLAITDYHATLVDISGGPPVTAQMCKKFH
jgi:hypothetical protein